MKKKTKTDREWDRKSKAYNENKYVCKHCGHKQLVPKFIEKNLCDWCGRWVFRDDKAEFEYRMQEALKKKK